MSGLPKAEWLVQIWRADLQSTSRMGQTSTTPQQHNMEEYANKRKVWDRRYSEKRKAARVLAQISQPVKQQSAGNARMFKTFPAPARQRALPTRGTLQPALPQVMTLVAPPSASEPEPTIELQFKYQGGGDSATPDALTVSISEEGGWFTVRIKPAASEDGPSEQDKSTWTIRIPPNGPTDRRAAPRATPPCEQQVLQKETSPCDRGAADAAGPTAQA